RPRQRDGRRGPARRGRRSRRCGARRRDSRSAGRRPARRPLADAQRPARIQGGGMVSLTWLRGLLARRPSRLIATALGVAVGVALIASIGTFLSSTTSKMTARAIVRVPVDWQVEVQRASDPQTVLAQVSHFGGVQKALPVRFADTTGLSATTGGSVQRTGP